MGTSFNGNLWMQYNTPVASGQIIKIGSVSLKVTVSSTSGSEGSGSGTVYYAPITLSNQQSSATSSGFQQMIYFNPSTYSSNEMANLSNIEFTADAPIGTFGNVPLYAWIESGASSSATNTVTWVNLASNTLGAAGSGTNTLTIYMNFLPNNSPVTSGYTGYAPQLYCASGCFQTSYAQYDDGANMFINYWNFAGTSLPSGWLSTGSWSGSVNNGLIVKSSSNFGGVYSQISTISNNILESYALISSSSSSDFAEELSTSSSTGNDGFTLNNGYLYGFDGWDGYSQQIELTTSPINRLISSSSFSVNTGVYYILSLSLANSIKLANINYQNTISSTDSTYNSFSYIAVGEWSTQTTYVQWLRTRSYPPNGVMPSASFGSII